VVAVAVGVAVAVVVGVVVAVGVAVAVVVGVVVAVGVAVAVVVGVGVVSRRMSCSMTIEAVRDQTKTVTRRHVDTWEDLKPGDRLTLIEKGMGLPKGAKQVVLAEVEIVDVYEDVLAGINQVECGLEGFPHMNPIEFAEMWARSHGYRLADMEEIWQLDLIPCRRIEWKYLTSTPEAVTT
jgi:hypothetical protein